MIIILFDVGAFSQRSILLEPSQPELGSKSTFFRANHQENFDFCWGELFATITSSFLVELAVHTCDASKST